MPRQLLRSRALLAGALLLAAVPAAAQGPAPALPGPLVSAEWLRGRLDEAGLVLLHVGEREAYDREHIPGARFVSLDMISLPRRGDDDLTLQMLPEPRLREALEGLGVSDGSTVVVYPAGGSVTPATRVVFAFQHAGLGERTALLDGGLGAWKSEGGRVTAEAPAAARGSLSPRAAQGDIVTAEWVRDRLSAPGVTVVDARAREFYDGTRAGGSPDAPQRRGHVAGAVSLPFSELTDGEMRFHDATRLRELFAAAGVEPGDTVVAYCHIGQQASAVAFAARLLGYDVRLYDGSFQEWSRRPELPVETRR